MKFVAVPIVFSNLLGIETIQELGFITINEECFISQVNAPQLGHLGEATHRIVENTQPKVIPCRKIPFAIKEAVKEESDRQVEKGVIVWVSQ